MRLSPVPFQRRGQGTALFPAVPGQGDRSGTGGDRLGLLPCLSYPNVLEHEKTNTQYVQSRSRNELSLPSETYQDTQDRGFETAVSEPASVLTEDKENLPRDSDIQSDAQESRPYGAERPSGGFLAFHISYWVTAVRNSI